MLRELRAEDAPGGRGAHRRRQPTARHRRGRGALLALARGHRPRGHGVTIGTRQTLLFTAGIDEEAHGLFGGITAVPAGLTPDSGRPPRPGRGTGA
jgi:hypothetical protein